MVHWMHQICTEHHTYKENVFHPILIIRNLHSSLFTFHAGDLMRNLQLELSEQPL